LAFADGVGGLSDPGLLAFLLPATKKKDDPAASDLALATYRPAAMS
jgi:hypothetical protein